MDVSRELLFFFSALGAFNGLILGLYYAFFKRPKHISNYFLGGFLICLSVRIGKSVFFYFNDELPYSYLQFGLSACFFVGPFLYFYLRSVYGNVEGVIRSWRLHLAGLIPSILLVNFLVPFEYNIDFWRPWIIYGIYSTWLIYSLAALPYIRQILSPQDSGQARYSAQTVWDLSLYVGNFLILAAYFLCGIFSYILGALLFSFMLYLMILQLVLRKREDFSVQHVKERYKDRKIEDKVANQLLARLAEYMSSDSRYTNSNIRLADAAKNLNVLPHTLSQVLNDNLGKSFPQYLNEMRIEAAKKMLLEDSGLTLEAIGYDCGFNSKSTFYSSFKKITGMTPASFQKQESGR